MSVLLSGTTPEFQLLGSEKGADGFSPMNSAVEAPAFIGQNAMALIVMENQIDRQEEMIADCL